MLEIKSFVSLKNECSIFWTKVHFKGGSQVQQNFEVGCSYSEGLIDLLCFFFFWGGGGGGAR